jgi:hypothetical protein
MALGIALATAGGVAEATSAGAPASEELDRLRSELDALRREYAERVGTLETRLNALEASISEPPAALPRPPATALPPAAPAQAQVPPGAAGAGGPGGALPYYGGPVASKIFNPDISVIGSFLGAAGSEEVGERPSLVLDEAEASFQAVVDPYARADFFFSYGEEGVEIEEGYLSFSALPGGLLMKAGKLRASFGKVNTLHTHAIPWTDRPIVTQNLVGGDEGISDAGFSLSRLIPNPWLFLEATAEVYRGDSEVFTSQKRSDLSYGGRLRAYQDITESSNLDLGGSIAIGKNRFGSDFQTRLIGADLTFRYRPLRRAIYRHLMARAEAVWSRTESPQGRADAFGVYAYGEYQFARRWYAGLRYDYSERALDPSLVDKGGSVFLTFRPSEFNEIRGQYRRTELGEGGTANEFLFQLLFSIGAHGAHPF